MKEATGPDLPMGGSQSVVLLPDRGKFQEELSLGHGIRRNHAMVRFRQDAIYKGQSFVTKTSIGTKDEWDEVSLSRRSIGIVLSMLGRLPGNDGTSRVTHSIVTIGGTVRMSAGDVYQNSGAWKVELTIRHQGGVIFRLKSAEDSMAAGKLAQQV